MSLIDGIRKLIHATEARRYESRVAQWMDELGGSEGSSIVLPHVIRRDVVVIADLGGVPGDRRIRLGATVAVPSGLRLPAEDRPDVPGLDEALARAAGSSYVLSCGGETVSCLAALTISRDVLDALIDAVVCVARYDAGLTETLRSLPTAIPLSRHELDPGVQLADGLLIGVREHARCVAQHEGTDLEETGEAKGWAARAGDGALAVTPTRARFTWAGVERDRERLLAGVKALRSLQRVTGPYR